MKKLDNLQYAVQILDGIRDIMMLLESSMIKSIPVSVCIVFETAIEEAISLQGKAVEAMGKEAAKDIKISS